MTAQNDFPLTREGWGAWRAARETALAAEYGWLTPVALHWLSEGPQSLAGLPGLWSAAGDSVRVQLAPGEQLEIDGAIRHGTQILAPGPAPWARAGRLALEPLARDGQVLLRIRNPEAPLRAGFDGVPVFDFDPDWVKEAEFVPFGAPGTIRAGSVIAGLGHDLKGIGTLGFRHGADDVRLTVVQSATYPGNLMFRDATSGIETAGSARQLSLDLPQGGGALRVDFNRAVNLPCSFTDFCTCPLPPPGNTLPFAVRAGEKLPLRSGEKRPQGAAA